MLFYRADFFTAPQDPFYEKYNIDFLVNYHIDKLC